MTSPGRPLERAGLHPKRRLRPSKLSWRTGATQKQSRSSAGFDAFLSCFGQVTLTWRQCPVFAPGMPLAAICEPAGFQTCPLACASTKEPFPGQFASFFLNPFQANLPAFSYFSKKEILTYFWHQFGTYFGHLAQFRDGGK